MVRPVDYKCKSFIELTPGFDSVNNSFNANETLQNIELLVRILAFHLRLKDCIHVLAHTVHFQPEKKYIVIIVMKNKNVSFCCVCLLSWKEQQIAICETVCTVALSFLRSRPGGPYSWSLPKVTYVLFLKNGVLLGYILHQQGFGAQFVYY